jgi:TonB family protein
MLELNPRPTRRALQARQVAEDRQPRRLVLALVILLGAFSALIVKDRDFWFPADHSQDIDLSQPEGMRTATAKPALPATSQTHMTPAPAAKRAVPVPKNSAKPAESGVVAKRAVLPPLDVEVIAGDAHRTVHPGSNAMKVEVVNPGSASKAPESSARLAAPTNAAELEHMNTASPAQGSFDGSYPLLAQQMRVQGSVVLQALIGADGIIENLRVLSGPGILASAAQQAVREWRFKPYLQNGQPVETKATITVNFTIRVADGATTTASLTPSTLRITQMAE